MQIIETRKIKSAGQDSPDSREGELDCTTWGQEWLVCTGVGGTIGRLSTTDTHGAACFKCVILISPHITLSDNYSYCHLVVTNPTLPVSNRLMPNQSQGFPQAKYLSLSPIEREKNSRSS